jgi:hypothetical protein
MNMFIIVVSVHPSHVVRFCRLRPRRLNSSSWRSSTAARTPSASCRCATSTARASSAMTASPSSWRCRCAARPPAFGQFSFLGARGKFYGLVAADISRFVAHRAYFARNHASRSNHICCASMFMVSLSISIQPTQGRALGSAIATSALARCYRNGTGVQKNTYAGGERSGLPVILHAHYSTNAPSPHMSACLFNHVVKSHLHR